MMTLPCIPRRALAAGLAAVLASAAVPTFAAQTFPAKPVTLVTWSPAGGPLDTLARLVANQLGQRWGQPVVVENRTGASGAIGTQAVARAAPDGYTLLLTTSTAHLSTPILQPDVTFDPLKDFVPIAQLAAGSVVLLAPAKAPYDDVDGLVTYAKAQNAGLSFGSWGIGTSGHLYGELLRARYDVPMVHVPYRGDVVASQDLVGGNLAAMFAGGSTARTMIDGGRAKAIALASGQRFAALPEVATFGEQGYAGFDLVGWAGIFAPDGVPADIVTKISTDLGAMVQDPQVRQRLSDIGQDAMFEDAAAFAARLPADQAAWAGLIREAGVTLP